MKKLRADQLLVERGLASTRSQARALIMAGQVLSGTAPVLKAGQMFSAESELSIKNKKSIYASRGGMKLDGALKDLNLDVEGLSVIDVGASTGGFTDCLLKKGAARVTAVDVGYGQLAWELVKDERVTVKDRQNARHLTPDMFEEKFDLAVIDVSFISLTLILLPIKNLLKPDGRILAMLKPQFEAGKGQVGKGGVVRDERVIDEALEKVINYSKEIGLENIEKVPSRLKGPKGNQEYFLFFIFSK